MSANDFITGRSLALPTCQFCYWPNYHQPIMLKIRLAWLWWRRVWPVLPWLRVIWLVDLTCERHEREFCTRPFKITELEIGRWSWISNCGEAFHTDSWLAEANPGHSDPDGILQALLPGPSTVVLFGPGKARMGWNYRSCCVALRKTIIIIILGMCYDFSPFFMGEPLHG